jgi:hypothetical protein
LASDTATARGIMAPMHLLSAPGRIVPAPSGSGLSARYRAYEALLRRFLAAEMTVVVAAKRLRQKSEFGKPMQLAVDLDSTWSGGRPWRRF